MEMKKSDKPIPECCMCQKPCDNAYGNNPRPIKDSGVCCNECNQKVLLVRMGMATINSDGELEFIPRAVKTTFKIGRLDGSE